MKPRLGALLVAWREAHGLGVRAAAHELGLSHATYSRIENGKPMSQETFVKVLCWLMGNPRGG